MTERSSETQDRLQVLRELIREGEASTQEELCNALKRKKYVVTQSTVSRDLRRIGAVKAVNAEGEIIYLLPEQHLAQIPRLSHDVSGLLVEIRSNESMIVLHTSPGSASLVAADLDRMRVSLGILGTLSGDDTVFVAPVSVRQISKVEQKIKDQYL